MILRSFDGKIVRSGREKDGIGDAAAVSAKASRSGFVSANQAKRMSSRERHEKLKKLYREHRGARLILDHAASRLRNQNATKVERLVTILRADGEEVSPDEVREGFRRLEKIGLGRYHPDRGRTPHFRWHSRMMEVARKAGAQPKRIDGRAPSGPLLTHTFHLRADTQLVFKLPPDLTGREIARLTAYLQTLPIEPD